MKCVYIKGNLLIKEQSLFYSKNLVMNATTIPLGAKIIEPEDGDIFVVDTGDVFGSPFYEYYVSGNVTFYGNSEIRVDKVLMPEIFKEKMNLILALLSMGDNMQGDIKQLFLQEQYMAVYSLIEYYLLSLILWGIQDEDRFQHLLDYDYDSIDMVRYKEMGKYRKLVQDTSISNDVKYAEIVLRLKKAVYHRIDTVEMLYKIIFGIDCREYLSILDGTFIDRRNDFTHRIGCNTDLLPVSITKEEVETLASKAITMCDNIHAKIVPIMNV